MFLTRPGGSTQAFFPGSRDCKDKCIFESAWWIGARRAGKREENRELSQGVDARANRIFGWQGVDARANRIFGWLTRMHMLSSNPL
jgi:hypothetical protein